jgi:hypothetical protein
MSAHKTVDAMERFNDTASSAATFIDDNRKGNIQSTMGSISHKSTKQSGVSSNS